MRLKQEVLDEQRRGGGVGGYFREQSQSDAGGRGRRGRLYVHAPLGRGILPSAIHLHRRLMVYMLH